MSNNVSALLSATFAEPGYDHLVELVHKRDDKGHRRLLSLEVSVYAANGRPLTTKAVDLDQEIFDLAAFVGGVPGAGERVMVAFDSRYDPDVFPYRPHHYAHLHARGSVAPALYYAVNAALGGIPDRIGVATRLNNFETYVFPPRRFAERYALLLGNVARFSAVEARVHAWYGATPVTREVAIEPRAHVEVPLAAESDEGRLLERVEVKTLFRLASYVTGRRDTGELVLFDHLFTYFK